MPVIKGTRSEQISISVTEEEIVKELYNMMGFSKNQYILEGGIYHKEDHGCSHAYLVDVLDTNDPNRVEVFKRLQALRKSIINNESIKESIRYAFK